MDSTVIWQFFAIFFAASLAFVLEDVRERRRTARWVKQHLHHLADMIKDEASQGDVVIDHARQQISAIDAWLAATTESDLSDEQWEAINSSWASSNVDLGPILRSEALSAVPEDLARSLAQLEHAVRYVEVATGRLNRTQDHIQYAWAHRETPLSPVNSRRVGLLREAVADLSQHIPRMYENLSKIVDQIGLPRNRLTFSRVKSI